MGQAIKIRSNSDAAQIIDGFLARRPAKLPPLKGKVPPEEVTVEGGTAILHINSLLFSRYDGTILEVLFPYNDIRSYDTQTALARMKAISKRILGDGKIHVMPTLTKYGFSYTIACPHPHPYPLRIDAAKGILLNTISHEKLFSRLLRMTNYRNIRWTITNCRMHRIPLPADFLSKLTEKTMKALLAADAKNRVISNANLDNADIINLLALLHTKLTAHQRCVIEKQIERFMDATEIEGYPVSFFQIERLYGMQEMIEAVDALSLEPTLKTRLYEEAVMLKLTMARE